jgi:hypothetical protein
MRPQCLDREPGGDEIDDHLSGDHQPRRLGLGRDIAEPDRGEHGDGEVGLDPAQAWEP